MPKRTGRQIRKDAIEAVRKKDEAQRKQRRSEAIKEKNKEIYERRKPGAAYRNPRVVVRETSCCLDKNRPMPEVFRQCPDCPKLTDPGYEVGHPTC